MLILQIQGETLEDIQNQIENLSKKAPVAHVDVPVQSPVAHVDVPVQSPVAHVDVPVQSPAGNLISVGQEWVPYPGGGFVGRDLDSQAKLDSDLDAAGNKWDANIHSAGKTKTANGLWRTKRGLPKEALNEVASNVVKPAAPVAETKQESYTNVTTPNTTKPVHSFDTFKANLPILLAELVNNGILNETYIRELNAHFGVSATWEIAKDEEKSKSLYEFLCSNGLITKVQR